MCLRAYVTVGPDLQNLSCCNLSAHLLAPIMVGVMASLPLKRYCLSWRCCSDSWCNCSSGLSLSFLQWHRCCRVFHNQGSRVRRLWQWLCYTNYTVQVRLLGRSVAAATAMKAQP